MQCKLPLGAGDGPVAFFGSRFSSWESYQSGSGYNGGEAYWGAGVDYVLRHIFNRTVRMYKESYPSDADRQLPGYHRIIIDAVDTHMLLTDRRGGVIKPLVQIPALKDSSILCRTRFFYYWPVHLNPLLAPRLGFDERSILTPYIASINTPVPIFPHSLITLPPISTTTARPRAGFLLGKQCDYMAGHGVSNMLAALNLAGFEVHVSHSCTKTLMFSSRPFGRRVQHGILTPPEFAKLMRQMAFVIGVGAPPDGPSALEALANGAAFLNPIVRYSRHPHRTASWRSRLPWVTLHSALWSRAPCIPSPSCNPHAHIMHTPPSLKGFEASCGPHSVRACSHVALD